MNVWFAECVPCRWREQHASEDAAITAAEDHVAAHHRGTTGTQRAAERIGHVQQRDTRALGFDFPAPAPAPAAVAAPEPAPAPADVPPAAPPPAPGE